MIFLVCAIGIAAGILLIPILWNINKVTGVLRSLLETNKDLINKTIKPMPTIIENAEHISANVRETTDKLKVSVPVILHEVEGVTIAAKGSIALADVALKNIGSGISETITSFKKDTSEDSFGFMAYFPIIKEIVQIIYRAFSSRK